MAAILMKKIVSVGAVLLSLLLFLFILSWWGQKQTSQNKEPEQVYKAQQLPQTIDQKKQTQQSSDIQAVEVAPKIAPSTVRYLNEKYGLKITFPSEVTGFETVETPLKNYHAYNPSFDIEFGKNKNDFFEEDGQKHGNMLSVWILDKRKCNDLKLDENEKSFCDDNKDVTGSGLWRGYERGDRTKGLWFGNENYLYYIFDPSFAEEKGLLGKIKVELLKTQQVQ